MLIGRSIILARSGNYYTYFCIDFEVTIHLALKQLIDKIKKRGINLLSIHLLTGGSQGLYAGDSENNLKCITLSLQIYLLPLSDARIYHQAKSRFSLRRNGGAASL